MFAHTKFTSVVEIGRTASKIDMYIGQRTTSRTQHLCPILPSFLPFLFQGFDDAFRALERLSIYVFDIPVNVAVRQFQDMSEAF